VFFFYRIDIFLFIRIEIGKYTKIATRKNYEQRKNCHLSE